MNYFIITVWIAIVYFLFGYLGHTMAIPPGIATPVWPASGFSVAMVLLFGKKSWLGIFLGTFLVTIEPIVYNQAVPMTYLIFWMSFSVGIGSLLQAIFAQWLINYTVANNIWKSANTFLLFSISTPLICIVSSSIGVTSLYMTDVITLEYTTNTWITWWLGDTVGVLLITPLILLLQEDNYSVKNVFPLIALYLILGLITLFSFGFFVNESYSNYLVFLSWPILLVFALNYERIYTSLAILIVSAIAITLTYNYKGPFWLDDLNSSLILLQTYIIAISVTSMTIVTLVIKQKQTEQRLRAEIEERLKCEEKDKPKLL